MELVLHGLSEMEVLNKDILESSLSFRDLLANMLDEDDMFDGFGDN
jgi:magnesium chelatase subunit I